MTNSRTIIEIIDTISLWIGRIGNIGGSIMIAFMAGLITVDVLGRFLFGMPTYIATEVSGYLMAAMVFLGLAWTSRMGQQIEVTIVVDLLSAGARYWVKFATLTISVVFAAWFCILTIEPVVQNLRFNSTSITTLRMPMWIPTLFVPVGLGMLAIQLFSQWLKQIVNIMAFGSPCPEAADDLNK